MTLTDRIRAKLEECRPYHRRLTELRESLDEPEENWMLWDSVERNLQLAVQCAIDVAEMVISWKSLERAEEYGQTFGILGRASLIEADLAERLARAAGLRNLLVHGYARIDRKEIRRVVREDLPDLESFARQIAALL